MSACEERISDTVLGLIAENGNEVRIATYFSISRNFLFRFLGESKKIHPKIALSVHVADDLTGWPEKGRAGAGVAVMPELVLRGNMRGVAIPEPKPAVTGTLGFAYQKGKAFIAVNKFVKYMKSALQNEK